MKQEQPKRSKHEYDAVLEDWQVVRFTTSQLWGKIYGDEAGRFKDGDEVTTSSLKTTGPYVEGNIVETRNTRYLLGKRAHASFDDGHLLQNTRDEQIESLRFYMGARGYNIVYSDSSVYFRLKDETARTACNQVSFGTAVRWHNKATGFNLPDNELGYTRFVSSEEVRLAFRKVNKVKLQVTGNRIIVQSHKVSYPATSLVDQVVAYQGLNKNVERNQVVELLDSLPDQK